MSHVCFVYRILVQNQLAKILQRKLGCEYLHSVWKRSVWGLKGQWCWRKVTVKGDVVPAFLVVFGWCGFLIFLTFVFSLFLKFLVLKSVFFKVKYRCRKKNHSCVKCIKKNSCHPFPPTSLETTISNSELIFLFLSRTSNSPFLMILLIYF